jgi:RNA polymerase sigma factor (TIGR02999 family)
MLPEPSAIAPSFDITAQLDRWRSGDLLARDALIDHLYPVLRAMAGGELRGGRLSLRATEVVHEAYLRLCEQRADWVGRSHFMAIAGQTIRRVVVDAARRREADKRGAEAQHIELGLADEAGELVQSSSLDWLLVDQELTRLGRRDGKAAEILELRYFAGLTNEEIAEYLGIGVATVVRHWQFGRAWLHQRLADGAR